MGKGGHGGHSHAGSADEQETFVKVASFWIIGTLTLLYCIGELVFAVKLESLTLLSDGFHNLSDVASLYIAYWALKASKRGSDESYTYGWARTELIGGLINGCSLLSLCVFIVLEAIPRFITAGDYIVYGSDSGSHGHDMTVCTTNFSNPTDAKTFIYVAAAGLAVNTIGTLAFAYSGHGHAHAGGAKCDAHGHSHGGDDHGHSHKNKKKKKVDPEIQSLLRTPTGDSDDEDDDHGHGHSHGEKKEKHGHSHGEKKEKHGHSHGEKKEKHGHSHGEKKEKHGHSHGEKKEKHGHSHGGDDEEDHGHSHGEKKKKVDVNVRAVFLHYLGDMLSSFFVLVTGLLFYFLGAKGDGKFPHADDYLNFLDPASSLVIVVLILFTTVPMVKSCAKILLQSTPPDVDLDKLKNKLADIKDVHAIHDLHVWQLIDGLSIASVHVVVDHSVSFTELSKKIKKVFHKMGIHSTSVQPEFVDTQNHNGRDFCEANCVEECDEDWCCKKGAEMDKEMIKF